MASLSERDLDALADAAESISDDLEERRRRALAAGDDEEIARIHEEYRRIAQVAHIAQRHAGLSERPLALVLALAAVVIAAVVLLLVLLF